MNKVFQTLMGCKGLFGSLQGWKIIQDGFKASPVDLRSVIKCLLGSFTGILDEQLLCFTLSAVNLILEILHLSPSTPQRSILFCPKRTLDQIYTMVWRLSCLVTQQDFISSGELQLLWCCCAVKQEMCVSVLRLSDAFPLLSHT